MHSSVTTNHSQTGSQQPSSASIDSHECGLLARVSSWLKRGSTSTSAGVVRDSSAPSQPNGRSPRRWQSNNRPDFSTRNNVPDQSYQRTPIYPLEKPLADDLNQEFSQIDRSLR